MNIENTIKEDLKNLLFFTDKLVEDIDKNKVKLDKLIKSIAEKDKGGKDTTEEIITHRSLMTYSVLLNDDLRKTLSQLSVYYKLALIGELDLELSESDKQRLSLLDKYEYTYFVVDKNKVISKDKDLLKKIIERSSTNTEFTKDDFLKSLRNSKFYE